MTPDAQLDAHPTGIDADLHDHGHDTHRSAATTWLSAAPTAALLVDDTGSIEWANDAAVLLLGQHVAPAADRSERDGGSPEAASSLDGQSLTELLAAAAASGQQLDDQRVEVDDGSLLVHVVDTKMPATSITPEQQRSFRTVLLELSELSHEISGDAAFYTLLAHRAAEVIPSVTACRVLVQRRDHRRTADRPYDIIASSDTSRVGADRRTVESTRDAEGSIDPIGFGRTTTTLSSPVVIDGEQVALIELDGPTVGASDAAADQHGLGAHAIEMAALLSRLVADLIRRRRLEAELRSERESFKHLAHHDPLTGLANRRQMEQAIGDAIDSASSAGDPIGLLYLDLDDFKSINDTFGHDAGDRVLVAVADILRLATRTNDLVCRWGGDEFVVLAPDTSSRLELRRLAERIIANLSQPLRLACGMAGDDSPELDVELSLSIGAMWCRDGRLDATELLCRADDALQRAKRAGKHTVRMDAA